MKLTDLNPRFTRETSPTFITSHAWLTMKTRHVEAFLNSWMTTESTGARPCDMTAVSIHSGSRAFLYSRLAGVQGMAATESGTNVTSLPLVVSMGTGEKPKTIDA